MAHFINTKCINCDACLPDCPTSSIVKGPATYLIDADTCTDCRLCVQVCPVDAIHAIDTKRLKQAQAEAEKAAAAAKEDKGDF